MKQGSDFHLGKIPLKNFLGFNAQIQRKRTFLHLLQFSYEILRLTFLDFHIS